MRLLHSTDLSCSTKVSVLPDPLLSTEALLSQGETEILHLCSSLCCSDLVQFIKASREGGRRMKKLYSCSHGPNIKEKKTNMISDNDCSRCKSGKVISGPARDSSSHSSTWITQNTKMHARCSRITQDHKLYFTTNIHPILEKKWVS